MTGKRAKEIGRGTRRAGREARKGGEEEHEGERGAEEWYAVICPSCSPEGIQHVRPARVTMSE